MGRNGAKYSRTAGRTRSGKDETLKIGGYVNSADIALMRIASEAMGAPFDVIMTMALTMGCQRLRETCPYDLPAEAMPSNQMA